MSEDQQETTTQDTAAEPTAGTQLSKILAAIRLGQDRNQPVTANDLVMISPSYRTRIIELRNLGHPIVVVRAGGNFVYRMGVLPDGPRKQALRTGTRYMFLVGPPDEAFLSTPYASAAERDAAALTHFAEFDGDADQFFWIDDPGKGGRPKAGPLTIDPGQPQAEEAVSAADA